MRVDTNSTETEINGNASLSQLESNAKIISAFNEQISRASVKTVAQILQEIQEILAPRVYTYFQEPLAVKAPPGFKNWILWYLDQAESDPKKQTRIEEILNSNCVSVVNQLLPHPPESSSWILWYIHQVDDDDQKKSVRIQQILTSNNREAIRHMVVNDTENNYLEWFILASNTPGEKVDRTLRVIKNKGITLILDDESSISFLLRILEEDKDLFHAIDSSEKTIAGRKNWEKILKKMRVFSEKTSPSENLATTQIAPKRTQPTGGFSEPPCTKRRKDVYEIPVDNEIDWYDTTKIANILDALCHNMQNVLSLDTLAPKLKLGIKYTGTPNQYESFPIGSIRGKILYGTVELNVPSNYSGSTAAEHIEKYLKHLHEAYPNDTPKKIILTLLVGTTPNTKAEEKDHFVTVSITPDASCPGKADIFLIDTFGKNSAYIATTNDILVKINKVYPHEYTTIAQNPTTAQKDSSSCGPLSTNIAYHLIQDIPPRSLVNRLSQKPQAKLERRATHNAWLATLNNPSTLNNLSHYDRKRKEFVKSVNSRLISLDVEKNGVLLHRVLDEEIKAAGVDTEDFVTALDRAAYLKAYYSTLKTNEIFYNPELIEATQKNLQSVFKNTSNRNTFVLDTITRIQESFYQNTNKVFKAEKIRDNEAKLKQFNDSMEKKVGNTRTSTTPTSRFTIYRETAPTESKDAWQHRIEKFRAFDLRKSGGDRKHQRNTSLVSLFSPSNPSNAKNDSAKPLEAEKTEQMSVDQNHKF